MSKIKRFLVPLFMAMLVSVMFGTVSMAASSATVAKIGSKEYSSLAAAFSEATSGDTIVLQKSVSYSKVLSFSQSGKKIILDLNNYTITFKKNAYLNVKKGNLTIQNGTMKKTGAVFDEENGIVSSTLIQTGAKGTVKIISGSYKGELSNNGKMTITGGTFTSAKAIVYDDTYGQGYLINNKGTMTIKGGSFKATTKNASSFFGTLVNNSGTLKITKGTFTSTAGQHLFNCGSLTISGGTFKASGNYIDSLSAVIVNSDGTAVIKGGQFTSVDCSSIILDWQGKGVKISGGTFTNKKGKGIATLGGNITISGGTFKSTDNCVESYLYEDMNGNYFYGQVIISNGTFTASGSKAVMLYASGGAAITVTGGSFTGSSAYKYAQIRDDYTGKTGKVTISGGTFNVKYGEYTE